MDFITERELRDALIEELELLPEKNFTLKDLLERQQLSGNLTRKSIGKFVSGILSNRLYRKSVVFSLPIRFPKYTTVVAGKGYDYLYPQAFTFHEDRLYILYGAGTPSGVWISVHDGITGKYISGFSTDATSYGESIVVKTEGAKKYLYTRKSSGILGKYDVTTLPADTATVNAYQTFDINLFSHFVWDEANDKFWVQQNGGGYKSSPRNRFVAYDRDFTTSGTDLIFDNSDFWPIASHLLPLNIKAQSITQWRGNYVIGYGAIHFYRNPETPDKPVGLRVFNDKGEALESALMSPNSMITQLREFGYSADLIENEGVCAYKNDLYAMYITSSHVNTGNYGILITKEFQGDLDFTPSAIRAVTGSSVDALNGKVLQDDNGLKNPVSGEAWTSLVQVIEFMRDMQLTELSLFTTGTPNLTDVAGTVIGTGKFVKLTTGNFFTWKLDITASNSVRNYWITGTKGALVQADLPPSRIMQGSYVGDGTDGRIISTSLTPVWGLIISRLSGGQVPMWVGNPSFNINLNGTQLFGGGSLGAGIGPVAGGFRVNAAYGNASGQNYNYVMMG